LFWMAPMVLAMQYFPAQRCEIELLFYLVTSLFAQSLSSRLRPRFAVK